MKAPLKRRKNYSLNECRILIVPPGGRPRITNLINQTPPFKVVYSGLVVQRAYVDLFVKSMPYVLKKYPKITGLSVTTNAVLSDRYNDLELKFILSSFERFHISIYGLDGEEYQTMTQKSHYTRMLLNVAKIVELADNKNNIVFGFRFLKSHTDDEIRICFDKSMDVLRVLFLCVYMFVSYFFI